MREERLEESTPHELGHPGLGQALTTADLAGINQRKNEPAATEIEADRERVIDRSESEEKMPFQARQSSMLERDSAKPAPNSDFNPPDPDKTAPLFSSGEADEMHERWNAIQVSFVDEPRKAVEQADGLVAGAMKRLAEIFADERARLDKEWDRGADVSTEELRLALRRYRSFFGRLLSV
jgi:hypothetical protein